MGMSGVKLKSGYAIINRWLTLNSFGVERLMSVSTRSGLGHGGGKPEVSVEINDQDDEQM